MFPVELRYIWPSELDLMAQLAGLRLRERWGGGGENPSIRPDGASRCSNRRGLDATTPYEHLTSWVSRWP